jgi:hypothetical protein
MTIQYLILDLEDNDEYVFDTPIDNPLDGEDPEVGLSYYYEKLNQTKSLG